MPKDEKLARSKRKRISPENLHISTFILVKKDSKLLLLKAGSKHPLAFRRGKQLLPASMLGFGEHPLDSAKRILKDQLENAENLDPKFVEMQSYLGAHWDLCFVYECEDRDGLAKARDPFEGSSYYSLQSLPRNEIAGDHLEVIDGLAP
ncbi:MAG: hypothetical protein ACYC7D_14020 [Nitrososphaerales archaeon]